MMVLYPEPPDKFSALILGIKFATKQKNQIKMFLRIISKKNGRGELKAIPDEELIKNYKKSKNPEIIGELFERYTHLIMGICLKYFKDINESKDAVMEIFEDLHQKLLNHDVANFKSWIYSVSKNHCLMALRRKKSLSEVKNRIYEILNSEIMESEVNFNLPGEDEPDIEQVLQKGIERLKAEQRKCIELLYLQNKSYNEVALITGYDLKKVKSYIQNGKRNLKIFMEANAAQ
ncbi:MAG: sigma-70 family RNA polymerase sigma factor [Bacteroidales bacterium]|nr:sigma-70 family RNA polymerase sigma factor [Bacteroidales bacterium]